LEASGEETSLQRKATQQLISSKAYIKLLYKSTSISILSNNFLEQHWYNSHGSYDSGLSLWDSHTLPMTDVQHFFAEYLSILENGVRQFQISFQNFNI
jgi:hypothetical protein